MLLPDMGHTHTECGGVKFFFFFITNNKHTLMYVCIHMYYICFLVYESIPLLLINATRRHDQEKVAQTTKFPSYTIALIAVALLLITVFIFVIIGRYHIFNNDLMFVCGVRTIVRNILRTTYVHK